jgi:pimeloyl-ACP methyl ester carboxylesterase
MPEEQHSVTVLDGRRLIARTAGRESTSALILLTGTPSGALVFRPLADAAQERGLRFVVCQRAGYGDSTRAPGRSVGDCARDVAAVANALGIERAHVVGWSGGGPHALACAALLPGLVASVATMAGVAPVDAEGLDWFAGMGPENVEEFGLALQGADAVRPFLERHAEAFRELTGAEVAASLGGLVSDVDKAALTGELADYLAAEFREAVRTGVEGWLDDDLAFARGWGFDLGALPVPVTIWQGAEDLMVPFAHGEWLAANVGGAQARLLRDEGHISLVGRFGDIVDDLVARSAG